MDFDFYTSVDLHRGKILVRGYKNGVQKDKEYRYAPYVFVPAAGGECRTLDGKAVTKYQFDSMGEAYEWIKEKQQISNFPFYGMINKWVYNFIYDNFKGVIDYDPNLVRVVTLDIEVAADEGFPNVSEADKEVTAISLQLKGKILVLGCGDFVTEDPFITYIKCRDEKDLLQKFILHWNTNYKPDIVTGWNVEQFDMVYMYNRIMKVLGPTLAAKMSPWGHVSIQDITGDTGMVYKRVRCSGIAVLDYMQLYKKFTFSNSESYKLGYIASVELGDNKVDYSEYGTLQDLYKQNFQKFIEYNIKDVDIVARLEDKLKFLEQVMAIAYDAKCTYIDTFTTVGMWDIIIHNYLLDNNIVVPSKTGLSEKDGQIAGAYVKDPQVGMHKWVVSFDLNSLYPHLIMQYNISPETLVQEVGQLPVTVDSILDGSYDAYRDDMIDNNCTIAATGYVFSKEKQGFLPTLMEKMYNERVLYKNKMIEAKQEYERNPSYEVQKRISQYHNMQLAKKIQLNSGYGALSNAFFRWFDPRLAESITLSGQLSIRWIEREMNKYLNKIIETDGVDYVLACDTDSMYLVLDKLVNKVFGPNPDTMKVIDWLDKVCSEKFEPYIDKKYGELAEYVNAYGQRMKMKREAIADKGIWTAKKRYILNVYDNEGVRFTEPKLKLSGIEAVRSSTPSACRESIKEALKIIVNGTNDQLIEYNIKFRDRFGKMSFEDVAFPRGVKDLNSYADSRGNFSKGCPIHVRGALEYNKLIKTTRLDNRYQIINPNEKIKFCYMKKPNPTHSHVFAVPTMLPTELGLEKYIDYETQFEKAYLEPLQTILDAIGWVRERKASLEGLFG